MKFIPRSNTYRQAARDADVARAAFLASLRLARTRLTPGQLKAEATQKLHQAAASLRHEVTSSARQHPFIVGGVMTAIIGILARKPIMALSRIAGVSLRKAWQARKTFRR